jgi:hypothetical protein
MCEQPETRDARLGRSLSGASSAAARWAWGTRDRSGWAGGGGGAPPPPPPQKTQPPPRPTTPGAERGPPRRGRVHSQEGAADKARGGIGCKPVSPRSGAPKARLAAKEETRQAAQALLASVNTPGSRAAAGFESVIETPGTIDVRGLSGRREASPCARQGVYDECP